MASSPPQLNDSPSMPSKRQQSCDFTSLDRHGYLFGKKITNSLSPLLHRVVYKDLNLNWGQIRLDSDDMELFLQLIRHPQFYGASVTMPNKVAILPHLDRLTPECRAVGACNTIFLQPTPDGRTLYCGANTDVIGIREALLRNVAHPSQTLHGRPALVVGGGGAARSAVYALRTWLRVTDIYLANRDDAEVAALMRECAERGFGAGLVRVDGRAVTPGGLAPPGIVVSCVPDLEPRTDGEKQVRKVVEEFFGRGKGVMLEMCYNPTPFTALGALAEGKGWQVILGTEALVWQGLEQDRYWTGREVQDLPVDRVHEAIAERIARIADAKL